MALGELRRTDRAINAVQSAVPSRISMYRCRRKCRQTDCDVLCTIRFGSAVLNPFSGMAYDGLACVNIQDTTSVRDPQHSFQNDGELFKIRSLPWLDPATRTAHVGDADFSVARIHPTNVF